MYGRSALNHVDKLLADELNALSVNEREQLMEKIHGISSPNTGRTEYDLEEAFIGLQNKLDMYYHSMCEEGTDRNENRKTQTSNPQNRDRTYRNFLFPDCTSSVDTSFDAYREARSKNSLMVSDRDFQRPFLEAENLDPGRAAVRLMKYLELIRDVFETSDVLFRPIFIDDLATEAKTELVKGPHQMLPDRDSSGRKIVVYLRDIDHIEVDIRHRIQVFLYFMQRIFEDANGMVVIVFLHNSSLFTGYEGRWKDLEYTKVLIDAAPRFDALHFSLPNRHLLSETVKAALLLVMGRENRYRVCLHFGSHVECRYSLASYGIPVNRLPLVLDLNTTIRKDNISCHKKWMRVQEEKEMMIKKIHAQYCQELTVSAKKVHNSLQNCTFQSLSCGNYDHTEKISFNDLKNSGVGTVCPSEVVGMRAVRTFQRNFVENPYHEDCLFGRGKNTMKHPGNIAMRSLLDQKMQQYVSTSHSKKSDIAWDVVKKIKAGCGRFLRELDNGMFEHVDDDTARKKISLAFRDAKSRAGKLNQLVQPKKKLHLEGTETGIHKRKWN
mmetsp:Transcript_21871/g.52036  ORF Transcript_21871/g.52036 Transcript_21871/m.52036 type:complete len:552 (-) Transcript_21871:109-1764(-)